MPPASTLPFRVRDVRLAAGSVSGSAPAAATIITIGDVTGLQIRTQRPAAGRHRFYHLPIGGDRCHGRHRWGLGQPVGLPARGWDLGPVRSSASTTFVDGEVPAGTINGTNDAFTLANVPNPSTSLALFRNGLLLTQGGDYTLSSNSITFAYRRSAPD